MPPENIEQRKLAAIMFTDMVGYSALAQRADKLAMELLEEHRQLLREIFPRFNGTEIKTIGDAFLIEFNSALEAAQCAIEIQRTLAKRNHDVSPERRIDLKIGIHIGDVVHRGGDVYGDGVNIASRIEPLAGAGGICVSMDVERQIRNALEARFEKLASTELKNISVAMDLFRIVLPWEQRTTAERPEASANGHAVSTSLPKESITPRTGGKWTTVIVGAAVLVAALLAFQFLRTRRSSAPEPPKQTASTATMDKSVAVLPFENLSSDKENAFFAQGIQDEIITALSRISGLRVVSRTSTAQYSSAPENLSEIAGQLHVSNVLEGSVQKAGDRVHINVQLIQADNDAHLWAQSYDRQLTDIFGVEGEVATRIADSLQATLSPQEKARVGTKPTTNPDAYVLYLRARDYQTRPDNFLQDFESAAQLYQQAIARDPNFALAHARLSAVMSCIYHWFEPTQEVRETARRQADESLRLQPDLGEGHLALGLYFYYEEANYEEALRELNLAARTLPNDGDVGLYIAAVQRRQGHFTEAIAAYQKAEAIDPRNSVTLYDAAQTYFGIRDWPNSVKGMDRVLALAPDSLNVKIQRAYMEFFWKGSTAPIKAVLKSFAPNLDPDGIVTFSRWDVALMDRDPDAAERAVTSARLENVVAPTGLPLPKSYLAGCVALMRNDTARAQQEFEVARPILEQVVLKSPQDGVRHAQLGFLYALMGRKDDASREAQRGAELTPISKDIVSGATVQGFVALIYARNGDADHAIQLVEHLLTVPFAVDYQDGSITLADLRTRWEWDPLRSDPRFQKIIAGPEPKTLYK